MRTALIIIIALLLGIYNGFFITGQSAEWHTVGFVIRLLLGILFVWKTKGLDFWMRGAIYLTLAWTIYDIIIALMMGQAWNYIGATSFFDTTIPIWLNQIAKFLVFFSALTLGALRIERYFKK